MNALIAVILGAITVYLTYTRYARRIDRNVIQSDSRRATPATLYIEGLDFMPTHSNILFGYHFKSIAAAGPLVGAIVAATLCGWLPAMIWLIGGVAFMDWVSDYSAIVMSVRNEGHSLSAVAHRLGMILLVMMGLLLGQMQEEYMKTIWEKFDGSVRALVPLFDQEVRGQAMLGAAAQKLMS